MSPEQLDRVYRQSMAGHAIEPHEWIYDEANVAHPHECGACGLAPDNSVHANAFGEGSRFVGDAPEQRGAWAGKGPQAEYAADALMRPTDYHEETLEERARRYVDTECISRAEWNALVLELLQNLRS